MKKIISLFVLCGLLFAPLSYAHFHYTITSTAKLWANHKKQLTAVEMSWLYDQEVSGMMLRSGQSMEALAKGIIDDLAKLHYFTQLEFNGKRIATERVKQYKLAQIKQGNKNLIKLDFVLPLQSPLFIQGNTLGIVHTDPGASASIFYRHANHILLGQIFQGICKASVQAIKDFEVGEPPELIRIHCR